MSSWERARFVPWSRMPQDGTDLNHKKEKIFRELRKEADQQEEAKHAKPASTDGVVGGDQMEAKTGMFNSTHVFRWGDMFKSAAFGGCIGAITGTVFGFMDGMRTAGQSEILQNASNMAKGRYLFQGTTRSATLFGVFFGGFHLMRYGVRVVADPGEWAEIGLAGSVSMGALMSQPAFRASMPYASMLIFMDCVHIIMREFND